jgi:hypothetical protein
MVAVILSGLASIAAFAVPAYLNHLKHVQKVENKHELRLMRLNTFDEVLHKAQLADLARDCIAGRETWQQEDPKNQ